MTVFLPFLQILDLLDNLVTHELKGIVEHLLHGLLLASHIVQANQHLRDGDGHIERALHALPPSPGAIAQLQLLEFLNG